MEGSCVGVDDVSEYIRQSNLICKRSAPASETESVN